MITSISQSTPALDEKYVHATQNGKQWAGNVVDATISFHRLNPAKVKDKDGKVRLQTKEETALNFLADPKKLQPPSVPIQKLIEGAAQAETFKEAELYTKAAQAESTKRYAALEAKVTPLIPALKSNIPVKEIAEFNKLKPEDKLLKLQEVIAAKDEKRLKPVEKTFLDAMEVVGKAKSSRDDIRELNKITGEKAKEEGQQQMNAIDDFRKVAQAAEPGAVNALPRDTKNQGRGTEKPMAL